MRTPATRNEHDHTPAAVWCMAFELSEKTWQLGCTPGPGQKPRARTVAARHQAGLLQDIAQAQSRCDLPETAPVVRCDEAGREGFWLQRFLQAHGSTNAVVDASAIAVNRRQRRAKSAGLDGRQLLRMLRRYADGERQVWRVVPVPAVAAEEQRHRPRDLETLTQARARTTPRIQGLLSSPGIRLTRRTKLPEHLAGLRRGEGAPILPGLRRRVRRVYAPHQFLSQQSAAWEAARRAVLHTSPAARIETGRQLRQLNGIGSNGAWGLVREFFAGRT
jgi:transposase